MKLVQMTRLKLCLFWKGIPDLGSAISRSTSQPTHSWRQCLEGHTTMPDFDQDPDYVRIVGSACHRD